MSGPFPLAAVGGEGLREDPVVVKRILQPIQLTSIVAWGVDEAGRETAEATIAQARLDLLGGMRPRSRAEDVHRLSTMSGRC